MTRPPPMLVVRKSESFGRTPSRPRHRLTSALGSCPFAACQSRQRSACKQVTIGQAEGPPAMQMSPASLVGGNSRQDSSAATQGDCHCWVWKETQRLTQKGTKSHLEETMVTLLRQCQSTSLREPECPK